MLVNTEVLTCGIIIVGLIVSGIAVNSAASGRGPFTCILVSFSWCMGAAAGAAGFKFLDHIHRLITGEIQAMLSIQNVDKVLSTQGAHLLATGFNYILEELEMWMEVFRAVALAAGFLGIFFALFGFGGVVIYRKPKAPGKTMRWKDM